MSEKTNLLNMRRSIKGRVTKLENHIARVLEYEKELINRKLVLDLQARLQNLEELQTKFNDVQDKLCQLITDELESQVNDDERENEN